MMRSQARARMRTAWGWGWSWPRARARWEGPAAQGLAWRESPAKSVTASRSCLAQDQRKVTARILPDWRVEGAAPRGRRGLRGGEPGAAVAGLGEQPGGADGAGAGQRGEDLGVGVRGELVADLLGQRPDLLGQGGQDGMEGAGDVGLRSP